MNLSDIIISVILMVVFFALTTVFSMFDGGFMIAMAVAMFISGIVSTIFFFINIARQFFWE